MKPIGYPVKWIEVDSGKANWSLDRNGLDAGHETRSVPDSKQCRPTDRCGSNKGFWGGWGSGGKPKCEVALSYFCSYNDMNGNLKWTESNEIH